MTPEATWSDVRLAVVDIEGNGRQPPDIVELSVVQMAGLTVGQNATWLLKPEGRITWHAKRIHGISNSDVEGCPKWADVATEVYRMLAGRALVAHNASVELKLLKPRFPDWVPPQVLDTLSLARRLRPDLDSHSLDALISEYGIHGIISSKVSTGPHRAKYDTLATAHLLVALARDSHGHVIPFKYFCRLSGEPSDGQQELF